MPKISNVDYEAIPGQARQMRSYGQDLNTEITNAYKSIENMHNAWYGKRYAELVKGFNKMVTDINELLKLVVEEIPYSLETVANNYSQADQGKNTVSANKTAPKKVTQLDTHSGDVGLKFMSTEVTSVKNSVSANFSNAKAKMNSIESEYNKIKWQSEAATAFRTKFTKLKQKITNSFDEIEKQFTKLMSQAESDMEKTEKANTVS